MQKIYRIQIEQSNIKKELSLLFIGFTEENHLLCRWKSELPARGEVDKKKLLVKIEVVCRPHN